MKINTTNLYHFLENILKYIALPVLFLLTTLAVFFQNFISFDILETSNITQNGFGFFLLLLFSIILLFIIFFLLKWIPENGLFIFLTALYMIIGVFLITHIQMILRYDSGICFWNAQNFVQGNYSNLQFGEYFYKYPHQLGLVSYNSLLLQFSENTNFIYYTNLFWILITNFFLWRTTKVLYPQKPLLRKIILLLSYAFMPQFFYLFYAYGQVPGLGCLMIAIYLTSRAIKKECKLSIFFSFFFIAAACIVRMNYVISGIALIIIYFLHILKNQKLKQKLLYTIAIIGILCSLFLPKQLIYTYYENAAQTDLSNGMPSSLFIAMGLQECPEPWRASGWYNDFNDTTYLNNNCDADICNTIAFASITERLNTFLESPAYAIDFFSEKIITTWCEPTFQSIWSGPLISMNCETNVAWLQDLYSGGTIFHIFATVMDVLLVILYCFSFVYVLWKAFFSKESLNPLELFSILFFLGGFIFHLFWETKSQYVYPYVVFLTPIAGNGLHILYTTVFSKFIPQKLLYHNET